MESTARRWIRRLAVALVMLAVSAGVAGCDDDRPVPTRLADGTPTRLSHVVFEGVSVPVFATTRERLPGPSPAACVEHSDAIDRVGVIGASRTSHSSARLELRGCDWTVASGWCGDAFARTRDEQPLDPRLSLTCRGENGEPVAFLWIDPGRRASYVVVTGRGYAEAYRVVRGVPVRVTTDLVDLEESSATVDASEHTLNGRLLRTRRIEAQVSG